MHKGIIPPLITPLTARDTLDIAGLERLVNRLIDGGVAGIFALGTTGEAPSLSHRLRREVVEHTCRFAEGRVPVLIGITDTSLVESAQLAAAAADLGADAVVTSAPFYFPAGQPELREFIEELLPELPLPLMLYNMPSLTKVSFSREVIDWALDQEKIVGLKGGPTGRFSSVRKSSLARPYFSAGTAESMAVPTSTLGSTSISTKRPKPETFPARGN